MSRVAPSGKGPETLQNCREPRQSQTGPVTDFLTDFPKSRVYAKLLRRLILECYQTFNGQMEDPGPRGHDSEAHQIGKPVNSYAITMKQAVFCDVVCL